MRVDVPPAIPVAIYDGECRFCGRWVELWQQKAGARVEFIQLQDGAVRSRFPEVPHEALLRAFHLIETDGTVHFGAKAIYRLLALLGESSFQWAYEKVPGFGPISEWCYKVIAANRMVISFLTRAFIPRKLASYSLVSEILMRGLGLIYLAAFWSLGSQILGLIGSGGITPIADAIAGAGPLRFVDVPTLCLWNSSDSFLMIQCWTGVVLAIALVLGFAPWVCGIGLWLLYLSITVAGGIFLSFQWDNFLLEAGFLAIFVNPWRLWLTNSGPPSRIVIWLFRWLMFRLMFESGCVKLLSGDETWWFLTALDFHYHTQPIPTPLAWYGSQLPAWFNSAFVLGMHIVELAFPFLIFVGRRARLIAALGFAALQIGIIFTGNYGFFNFLTLVLCIPLLDDEWLLGGGARFRKGLRALRKTPTMEEAGVAPAPVKSAHPAQWWALLFARTTVAGVVIAMTLIQLLLVLRVNPRWPTPVVELYSRIAAFRSVNAYGLFAHMTTTRPELIVEGSADGERWVEYDFRYKPDNTAEPPPQIGPHMPRLDWQMWFAALGRVEQNPWFVNFCGRLLQNEPTVTALLQSNPFPGSPPKVVRARLYEYKFTDRSEEAKGAWWERKLIGEYLSELSLKAAPKAAEEK